MAFEIKEDGEVVKCEMTNQKISAPKPTMPKTGDTTNAPLLLLGMILSAGALSILIYRKKKAKIE